MRATRPRTLKRNLGPKRQGRLGKQPREANSFRVEAERSVSLEHCRTWGQWIPGSGDIIQNSSLFFDGRAKRFVELKVVMITMSLILQRGERRMKKLRMLFFGMLGLMLAAMPAFAQTGTTTTE
jgi:hypothetical protein